MGWGLTVSATPMTSRPSSAIGIARFWISVGVLKSRAWIARFTAPFSGRFFHSGNSFWSGKSPMRTPRGLKGKHKRAPLKLLSSVSSSSTSSGGGSMVRSGFTLWTFGYIHKSGACRRENSDETIYLELIADGLLTIRLLIVHNLNIVNLFNHQHDPIGLKSST